MAGASSRAKAQPRRSRRPRPVMSRTVRSGIWLTRYMAVSVFPVPGGPYSSRPRLRCRPAARSCWRAARSQGCAARPLEDALGQDDLLALDPGVLADPELPSAVGVAVQGQHLSTVDVALAHRRPQLAEKVFRSLAVRAHHLDSQRLAWTALEGALHEHRPVARVAVLDQQETGLQAARFRLVAEWDVHVLEQALHQPVIGRRRPRPGRRPRIGRSGRSHRSARPSTGPARYPSMATCRFGSSVTVETLGQDGELPGLDAEVLASRVTKVGSWASVGATACSRKSRSAAPSSPADIQHPFRPSFASTF